MAGRARVVQHSFAAGEVSPRIYGRSDTERYGSACETLENFQILRQGGVTRRPGTKFVAEAKLSAKKATLIPFQFNDQQAYIIEAGDLYFRFYRNSGQVFAADTDAAITNGTFTTDLTGWTERNAGTGDVAQASGVARFTANGAGNEARLNQAVTINASFQAQVHVIRFKVVAGTLRFRIGTAAGGEQIKVATDYKTGWHTVEFTPNATTFHPEFENNTAAVADLDDVAFFDNTAVELTTPYTEIQIPDVQFDQSADVMWLCHRSHKPRKLQRFGDASWSLIEYTPTSDPFTSAGNRPRAVGLWNSRIWFAGTDNDPRKIWGSEVDNFESLDPGTAQDDEAIQRTVTGGKQNVIQWLVPSHKEMFVGTYGSEMMLRGDASGVVTPKNCTVKPVTEHGSALIKPIRASNYTFFLQRSRKKLRQFVFNFNEDVFQAIELTTVADHITGTGLSRLSYHEDPEPIIWGVRDDGQLIGMTYHPSEKLLGWHRHVTDGLFEAVATIPHQDQDRDQTWVIVKRIINGATKRYVEYLDDGDGFYGTLNTDCALTGDFSPTPVTSVTGLGHLEGETVDIVGDGAVYPQKVVANGAVSLDPGAKVIEVGLPYKSKLVTLRPESDSGTIQATTVARGDVAIRVLNTVVLKVNGASLPDRSSEDLMDAPPSLFTGDLQVPTVGWGTEAGKVTIEQDLPLPATILSISGNLTAGDF